MKRVSMRGKISFFILLFYRRPNTLLMHLIYVKTKAGRQKGHNKDI